MNQQGAARAAVQAASAFRAAAGAVAAAALLAACAGGPPAAGPAGPGAAGPAAAGVSGSERAATLQRTAHGVAHVSAPDFETLAYGMAYAYAQDNVCLTAQHLVTVRGERARTFGASASGLLGLRRLPNEIVDLFIAAHMDDAALARAAAAQSAESQALARGYVAGYNRYLADHGGRLPAACNGAAWVKPMTPAEYLRIGELTAVQAGIGALADAMLGAAPPKPAGNTSSLPAAPGLDGIDRIDVAAAAELMREAGLVDSPFGSNAWAFGRDSTRTGHGMLLGNPHFPWVGVNRFWQVHLTVPGRLDVMGVAIGTVPTVVIGFNKDVAWSHTVSTGRRFTLHELTLVPGDPTSYVVDGQPEKMRSRTVTIDSGKGESKTQTLWSTRWGPVVSLPRAGLAWSAQRAYALQDANAGNARAGDTWLDFGRAASVEDLRRALANLGTPWVNTIAADRHGNAFYADASVVPDVDAAMLQRCAPGEGTRRLLAGAGLVVLDGSKSDCRWRRDPASPVPGLTPIERLPVTVRSDWVHNSNDSFFHTHPAQRFGPISPLVGDDVIRQPRTRAGLVEIPELLAAGPVTLQGIQRQLFGNRNHVAEQVLPDLLAACTGAPGAPTAEARDGCAALGAWDRKSDLGSRGAHVFREFWRGAMSLPRLWRVPPDRARPLQTPSGLNLADAEVAAKVWEALAHAVKKVRAAGFALDATLAEVQRPAITDEAIALHGGHSFEGVLNFLGDSGSPGIGPKGIRIDYGTSYVQTVTFDARGPVAEALLTYGQSTDPASPHVADQLRLYSRKVWPRLPFHADEVARERVGAPLRLVLQPPLR
ncbi:MAG: penicillin acylase family protein [Burkholderiales bacterium]|nr:penicillin acylase family protein [Burkholderiales bacterium]